MNSNERNVFYAELNTILRLLSASGDMSKDKLVRAILMQVNQQPYATLAFLYLFKYFHEYEVDVDYYHILPFYWCDDLLLLYDDRNVLNKMAVSFDEA